MKSMVRLKDCGGGRHLGSVEMPLVGGGSVRVQTLGWDPFAALRRAASAAVSVASDPALAAFLPPQVTAAAHVARGLTKMGKGGLKKAAAEGEPSTQKLAIALLKLLKKSEEEGTVADVGASLISRFFGGARKPARTTREHRVAPGAPRGASTRAAAASGGGTRITTSSMPLPPGQEAYPPPGYPGGYPPPPGYPPGYPPPGYPYPPPGYPYPPQGYPPPAAAPVAVNPLDTAAMQAWGADAFTEEAQQMSPDPYADQYFQGYEDYYYSPDADYYPNQMDEGGY